MKSDGIKNFLNNEGKVKSYPAKQSKLILVLEYLSAAFDKNAIYSEPEVNEIINGQITFEDFATLRRDLVDFGFLVRDNSGSEYRAVKIDS